MQTIEALQEIKVAIQWHGLTMALIGLGIVLSLLLAAFVRK